MLSKFVGSMEESPGERGCEFGYVFVVVCAHGGKVSNAVLVVRRTCCYSNSRREVILVFTQ